MNVATLATMRQPEPNSGAATIQRLDQDIHRILAPLIGDARSFALVDFPDHNNVGDSAIWLGELAYLQRRYKTAPAYVCRADRCDYGRLSGKFGQSLLLLHGGGNFGDLWRWHHDRREALLERLPGRRIVQLPQSLMFESKRSLERTAKIIARHGNFVLCVRDNASYALATAAFDCQVVLCPDSAFALGALPRSRAPERDVLFLLRDDHERVGVREPDGALPPGAVIDDWRMDRKLVRAQRKLLAAAQSVVGAPRILADGDALRSDYFYRLARARFERGLALMSSGRYIVTDRLHAYILALLLDIPRSVIDNSYGKISGFIDTWMQGDERVNVFRSLDDALAAWPAAHTAVAS